MAKVGFYRKKKVASKKAATKKTGKKKASKKKAAKKAVTKKKVTKKKVTKKKITKKASKPAKKTTKKKAAKTATKGNGKNLSLATSGKAGRGKIATVKPPSSAIAVVDATNDDHKKPSLTQLRKTDSGLSRKEKEQLKTILVEKRTEILGDVESLQTSAMHDAGDLSNMPLHMADAGTDQYEQEATLGLMESELRLLKNVNDALTRMNDGTYGVCLETGKPIGMARLEYKPWAKYTIEIVRERERRGEM